ncbi:MAG TPA: MogA/MoaB family molybdenum cofactor biosynthesis protein [Nitrososphaerales archaeon]|nr:MogA/MoaB family molybdenum cofactor biosynthesis protein [Nitrososphaerales archaeon]
MRIVTVSSSRYQKKAARSRFTDESGDVAEAEVRKEGHHVTARGLISDDAKMIKSEARKFLDGTDDILLFTGGTGVSRRDITIETVRPFFQKELPGFGELLRRISYGEIGGAAMLTRATAGTARGKLLVCLPGSPDAVRTALRASASEFPHIVSVARRPLPTQ